MNNEYKKYDVVVIGAGVGGLVAGCYLAKAGMKVLLIEQHTKPGGYCSSFNRKGFTFDSCIHYIKLAPYNNLLNRIFEELNIKTNVKLKKINTSDLIITSVGEFYVHSDVNKTIKNLIALFPRDKKNIENFFEFLNTKNTFLLYSKAYKKTFGDIIRYYFDNKKIIAIFDSLLMNIGLPIDEVHALKAYYFFREFFFTQSYYPEGGMQQLSNALNKTFHYFGGDTLYGTRVNKILTKEKKVQGVVFNDTSVLSDFVVSNIDPYATFFDLIDKNNISKDLYNKVKLSVSSISAFIVYLGLSKKAINKYPINNSIWYFPDNNFSDIYKDIKRTGLSNDNYLICSFPSSHDRKLAPNGGVSLSIVLGAHFKTRDYWEQNKKIYADNIIKRAKVIFPNITDCLEVVSIATPQTLFDYTRNHDGACYGLASIKQQIDRSYMPQKVGINNLLMAGHWTTHGIGQGGLSMVAYSGLSAANKIININNGRST